MPDYPRRSRYLQIAGHEIHLCEWGDPTAPPVIMWHGLARTCRDFDTAAAHLSRRFRVICPDTIGRGLSSWSANPGADYTMPAYLAHAQAVLDQLDIERCAWVGTSMGGVIGLAAASGPLAGRIDRLVLNDAAPKFNAAALARIKAYVTFVPDFPTIAEFELFQRTVYAPFGFLTDAEWRTMAETSVRRRDNGRLTTHYDPQVMAVFAAEIDENADLWELWDRITCPVLMLRGEASDLVSADTAREMTGRGPKARLVTVPGCGHAPALNVPAQLAVLEGFLAE
jgi:pimeloyl-ACP methyl ester carboxylesterase